MTKIYLFSLMVIIGFILVCGCIGQSNASRPVVKSATPAPTPNDQYKINEPATDGNLRVTVLNAHDGDRSGLEEKKYYVWVKLENLRSDKEIQVYPQDFTLITKNGAVFTTIFFYMTPSQSFDLQPNTYGDPELEFYVPLDAVGSKLKFDFSRPSGVLKGGKIVYFNL